MLTETRKVVLAVIVLVVALGVVVATLGEGTARPDRDGRLEVVLDGAEVAPSHMTVPSDEPVTFIFVNRGETAENLTIGRDARRTEARTGGFAQDLLAGLSARVNPPQAWIAPSERVPVVTIHVAPQGSTTVTLTLPEDRAGEWELACFRGRDCVPRGPWARLTVE